VDEQDGRPVAPAPRGEPAVLPGPARRAQRDVDLGRPAAREHGELAVGAAVPARRCEPSFGEARAELLGDDEGGLERRAGEPELGL
jgi:hypothetical protein